MDINIIDLTLTEKFLSDRNAHTSVANDKEALPT